MRRNILYALLATLMLPLQAAEMRYNLPKGVTQISHDVYALHMTIFFICCLIGCLVFGVMFYSMYRHRKSRGAIPSQFHENVKAEVTWTIIPFIILALMAIPATKTLVAMENTDESELTILVTGSQWKWHYEYFEQDVAYFSLLATSQEAIHNQQDKGEHYLLEVDKPLILPTHRKVRFLFTSDDVIHSWWMPEFSIKKDVLPGFINESWVNIEQAGVYRGQCTELCGKDHAFMPIVVKAIDGGEFDDWLAEQKEMAYEAKEDAARESRQELSMTELMQLGEAVYVQRCAACHQVNGLGLQGIFPALKDSDIVKNDIAAHIDIVVNGVAGTAMQSFKGQLSNKEIAAVVTYERNAWGNATQDIIQPADIASAKAE